MFKFSSKSTCLSQNLSKAWEHNIELSLRDEVISISRNLQSIAFKLVQCIFETVSKENNMKIIRKLCVDAIQSLRFNENIFVQTGPLKQLKKFCT